MPAEWTAHSCTWMAWPCRAGMWSDTEETEKTYANVANAIAEFELVKILAQAPHIERAQHLLSTNIEVI